jgi:hypothetical protein
MLAIADLRRNTAARPFHNTGMLVRHTGAIL